jgi:mycoredoxin
MAQITIYCTSWCCDCRRAKQFLRERGVAFREVNIDEAPDAEELILRVNGGRRKVPTIEVEGRYFACSPFDPHQIASELNIPLNPTNATAPKRCW